MGSRKGDDWGAIIEAASLLKMVATYTQSDTIPQEQYMRLQEIVGKVIEDKSASSAAKAVAKRLRSICPHGSPESRDCERCVVEAYDFV